MNKNFYLVVLTGMYRGADGDHTHFLTCDEQLAKQKFNEWKEEIKSYYLDENKEDESCIVWDTEEQFSFRNDEDSVDIYVTELTLDKEQFTIF